jgi:hypothetical protein
MHLQNWSTLSHDYEIIGGRLAVRVMQEVIGRVKAVVAAFDAKRKDLQIERIEQLARAIADCRDFVEKNEKTDRGCTQRLAREIDEILGELPQFRHLANKADMSARHTKRLAEEHLLEIQKLLDGLIESDKKAKTRDLREWVNKHPVLGPLRRACIKKGLPKDAFVLLFEKNEDGELELMPRSVEENSVLTRFRPSAFVDDERVQQTFAPKKNLAGAAVIADNKLVEVMGEVPPPTGNKDQLQVLLFHSNEVASGPSRQFVESNDVLKTLHQLAKKKDIPKDAYVLLFKLAQEETQQQATEDLKEEEKQEEITQEPIEQKAEEEQEEAAPPVTEEEPVQSAAEEEETAPAIVAEEEQAQSAAEEETAPAVVSEEEPAPPAVAAEETSSDVVTEDPPELPLEIVDKTTAEGKVITRFWSNDFVRKHHLFEMFRDGNPLVGAAVIKDRDLVHAIGILPRPKKNQSQLDAILQHSNKAVQRPSIEFVQNNEVLNGLNQLANDPSTPREAYALLFTRTATTPYFLFTGKFGPRIPLEEFKTARIIHQRYGDKAITGAAVISEQGARPSVTTAFGRSPLKQSMLATPENFQRLGLPVEIVAPPRTHDRGRDRDRDRGRPTRGQPSQGPGKGKRD